MPRKTRTRPSCYLAPFDAARKMPMLRMFSGLPRLPNTGMMVLLNLRGLLTYDEKNSAPWPLAPIELRSGAPWFEEPVPRYVWHEVQPDCAKSFAPATAFASFLKPCRCDQTGTACVTSLASDSFATAPLYVSTPIERTTRIAATIATGRRRIR